MPKTKTIPIQAMSLEERYRIQARRNLELQKENALLRRQREQVILELDKLTAMFNRAIELAGMQKTDE